MAIVGLTQTALAKKIGVTQGAISHILVSNTRNPRRLYEIARHLKTTPEYLIGETDDPDMSQPPADFLRDKFDSVTIPELDIGYSMGGGALLTEPDNGNWNGFDQARTANESDDNIAHLPAQHDATMRTFPRAWLEPLIKGRIDQVFIARGEGDSMQPTLLDGDVVIIDRAQDAIAQQDRLWAIGYGELVMIKRVRRMPDGGYQINSDNPAVTPITAYDDEMHVVGRVVWIGRKV